MEILLPQLERIIYHEAGSKNGIRQLVAKAVSVPLNITVSDRASVTINHQRADYYFTSKEEGFPGNQDYVLLTNIIPTKERFESNQIIIKKWLKQPQLKDYSVQDVIKSWKNNFNYKEEEPENNLPGLRQPQIAALHSIMGHLKLPLDGANVIMPTGTGKTETMLATLVANQCQRLLVTVPSDSLRQQIAGKFFSLGLLKQFEIVGNAALYPITGVMKNKFDSLASLEAFITQCNVVVTTMDWLTGQTDK
jgi:hypothetical protein